MNKKISTPLAISIIVVLAVSVIGVVLAYQYYFMPKISDQKPIACTKEAKICPDGSTVGRTGPNCEFTPCPITNDHQVRCAGGITIDTSKNEACPPDTKTYNNAGKIIKVYQKNGKNYIDVDLIKFVFIPSGEKLIYGGKDEPGDCNPELALDGYCIVNNDKTIKSYEVAENIEIINSSYPGNLISLNGLEGWLIHSSYFRLQVFDDTIERMHQIYIP